MNGRVLVVTLDPASSPAFWLRLGEWFPANFEETRGLRDCSRKFPNLERTVFLQRNLPKSVLREMGGRIRKDSGCPKNLPPS